MSKLEQIEKAVSALSPEELARFREWFASYDAELRDGQIEGDIKAGKLDKLADRTLEHRRAGGTKRL